MTIASLILTPDEIKSITGKPKPATQAAELARPRDVEQVLDHAAHALRACSIVSIFPDGSATLLHPAKHTIERAKMRILVEAPRRVVPVDRIIAPT